MPERVLRLQEARPEAWAAPGLITQVQARDMAKPAHTRKPTRGLAQTWLCRSCPVLPKCWALRMTAIVRPACPAMRLHACLSWQLLSEHARAHPKAHPSFTRGGARRVSTCNASTGLAHLCAARVRSAAGPAAAGAVAAALPPVLHVPACRRGCSRVVTAPDAPPAAALPLPGAPACIRVPTTWPLPPAAAPPRATVAQVRLAAPGPWRCIG